MSKRGVADYNVLLPSALEYLALTRFNNPDIDITFFSESGGDQSSTARTILPVPGATPVSVSSAPNSLSVGSGVRECAGCGKRIVERFLLKALDLFWHEDCLKCGCCDCRLGEVGSTLYTKANLILCKRDYLR
ncbi:hypothetical protein NQ317_018875 [Molorchus minor]|uniref:LIM zinc-binding domain-containing protein n=1 Tax=Molorchus minor TaxID=1323400 RepID=A0ABQ9J913_9CUCU|nr:hypothetical protein NQ317_018875 [Molorchus minor]